MMQMVWEYAPNLTPPSQSTPGDNTAWHKVTIPLLPTAPGTPAPGATTWIGSVVAAGNAPGDTFQMLTNQGSQPSAGTPGLLIPPNVLFPISGVPNNIWVKLTTGSDLINVAVAY